jgi:hypothetical protein
MRSNLALWFYGACAVLLVGLTLEWLPAGDTIKLPPPKVPHLAAADESGTSKDTDEWAETITARPLFTVGRHPPKSNNGPHTISGNGLPRLAGIMITPYGRHAIFMPDGGKPLTLAEGANLDENTIRKISSDRVLLVGPKGQTVLLLTFDKQGIGGVATPNFVAPNFNPGFPRPGFQPGMPGQPMTPGRFFPPPAPGAETPEGTPAPPQFPGFRGPNIPGGRE